MPVILFVILGYVFYVLSISIHILVMTKVIDYKLVNGGRSESFKKQFNVSLVSIIILLLGLSLMVVYHLNPSITQTLFNVILMSIFSVYWLLGFIMQLMGTTFERRVMSEVVILGFVVHLLLWLTYFTGI